MTLNLWISTAFATKYILERVFFTCYVDVETDFNGCDDEDEMPQEIGEFGMINDSLADEDFNVEGTMKINNGVVTQNITFCKSGRCKVFNEAEGSVISTGINNSTVSIQYEDNSIEELTLISLEPSIITMFIFPDSTIELHEWRVSEGLSTLRNSLPGKNKEKLGAIGRSRPIVSTLKSTAEK